MGLSDIQKYSNNIFMGGGSLARFCNICVRPASYEGIKAFFETDQTEDLKALRCQYW
jgi:hypothetical protein